ncbi:MAG: YihY/virulence factor BrkB family protein [Nitrospiraceae bacterium]|nr:MAG: YihY/virulence factor BrkB family protein [Nitrospiraceae bacterium]
MYLFKVFGRSLTAFFKDDCFYLAASIAYFLIVSLVPLSLLIIALYGHIMGENVEVYRYSLSRLMNFFPSVTSEITDELRDIITYKGISWITLFIYGFLSIQLFYSMERAMNVIFRVPRRRHFLLFIFWTVIIVTLVIIFLFLSFTLSSFLGAFREYPMNIFGVAIGYKAGIFLKYIAPFLLVLSIFTAVFKIVPRVKVALRDALAGALLVTVLWELAKHFFTWTVKNMSYIGTIYGSLSTFILFLLWMYYISCIFLLGGEFVKNLSGRS